MQTIWAQVGRDLCGPNLGRGLVRGVGQGGLSKGGGRHLLLRVRVKYLHLLLLTLTLRETECELAYF